MASETPVLRAQLEPFGSLWGKTWNDFRTHARTYVPIGIISVLAGIVTSVFTPLMPNLGATFLLNLVGGIANIILGIFAGAAMVYAIIHPNEITSFMQAFQKSQSLLGRWVGANLLVGLIVLGGIILFIVPGIIWAVMYVFAAYVVIRENLGVTAALRRSKELTRGRWFDVFWRTLVFSLIVGGLTWAVLMVADLVTLSKQPISTILGTLATGVITPLGMIFLHYLYQSLISAKNATPAPDQIA